MLLTVAQQLGYAEPMVFGNPVMSQAVIVRWMPPSRTGHAEPTLASRHSVWRAISVSGLVRKNCELTVLVYPSQRKLNLVISGCE